MFRFTIRHSRHLEIHFRHALVSPATFLTGDHAIQIGFDRLHPLEIWEEDYWMRCDLNFVPIVPECKTEYHILLIP